MVVLELFGYRMLACSAAFSRVSQPVVTPGTKALHGSPSTHSSPTPLHADETEQTSHHIRDRQSQDSYCANRDSRRLRTSVSTTTACSCCRPSSPQPSMRNPG